MSFSPRIISKAIKRFHGILSLVCINRILFVSTIFVVDVEQCSKFYSRIDIPCMQRSVGMDMKLQQQNPTRYHLSVVKRLTAVIHTGAFAQQSKHSSLTMYTIHASRLTMHHLCWLVDTSDDSRASSRYVSRLCRAANTSWFDRDSSSDFPVVF
jgi:hypothetical protein